jgi:signal transduction histidine kinase
VIATLASGWLVALACVVAAAAMRRRLERVADAEHELRGALTAFGLVLDRRARDAAGRRLAAELECELARAHAALADLCGARLEGGASGSLERLVRSSARAWAPAVRDGRVEVDWSAGSPLAIGPPGRIAQALGNLVSNAVEHGDGRVLVRVRRAPGAVRVEVSNRARPGSPQSLSDRRVGGARHEPVSGGRGRGLRIAGRAAQAAGGRLAVGGTPDRVVAALDLPVQR